MEQRNYAFNRGIVSEFALARMDQERLALSAETMTNFLSRKLGPMVFRPGMKYLGSTASDNAGRLIPFVFGTSDVALIELTASLMRVWSQDALVTRAAVTSAVSNGSFTGNITGWTDGSDAGGAAAYKATDLLQLTSNGTARAIAHQTVTAVETGTEHALRIDINRGPVTFSVGSALGLEDYVTRTELDTGFHSLTFTPTGDFVIQFQSTSVQEKLINSCEVESSGTMTLTTPWPASVLGKVRFDQSGDIVYVACDGYAPRKIERRGTRPNATGWSIANYDFTDGPFRAENLGPITIAADATTGNPTLTASAPLFRAGHVGSLWSMTNFGQSQTKNITAQNTFSSSILVTGLSRSFGISITGTLAASTVVLQSSTDDSTWSDVDGQTWTATTSTSFDDTLLNQQIYYRIGVKTGDYGGADDIDVTLSYDAGSQRGIVRITAVASSTSASAEVLVELGATTATDIWQESVFSSFREYPTCVRLIEGRLWWYGKNWIVGSVSDGYTSFDETVLGNSGPIVRTIGAGPVDVINWALDLRRMIIGAEGREVAFKSSNFEAPLTPLDFKPENASTQGSAAVEAQKIDLYGIFVHRNGVKVYQIMIDGDGYRTSDLMTLCPEIATAGIVRMAVQRQPDTRIHCVLSDGSVVLGMYSDEEQILSWQTVTTGTIEDAAVLPAAVNTTEDQVYYLVKRSVNGSTVRYLEKWAREDQCRGSTTSCNMDSYVTGTNSPASATISGLTHLEGESVVVWADGAPILDSSNDPQTYTVSSGAITLSSAVTDYVVGLSYTGQWKSTKLGQQIARSKAIKRIGFMLAYHSRHGVSFGPDFSHLDNMPSIEEGTTASDFYSAYEEDLIPFPMTYTPDLRLCMQCVSPMPATALAAVMEIES